MALLAVCRVGSMAQGVCTSHSSTQNWTGFVDLVERGSELTDEGFHVATVGSSGAASCGHRFYIVSSSSITTAPNGARVGRVGDPVAMVSPQNGSGVMVTGSGIFFSE